MSIGVMSGKCGELAVPLLYYFLFCSSICTIVSVRLLRKLFRMYLFILSIHGKNTVQGWSYYLKNYNVSSADTFTN